MIIAPFMSHTKNVKSLPTNLREVIIYFADLQVCHDFLTDIRFPSGVACPRCGDTAVGFVKTRRIWNCRGCKKQFSVKVGTIFEDSPLGLDKWLPAVWLIVNAKNGISSYELARALDVTQKTAWFMLHRIRVALEQGSFTKSEPKPTAVFEADETFVGGKAKNMHKAVKERKIHGRGAVGKAVVMGLLERGETYVDKHGDEKKTPSRVITHVIPDTTRNTLHAHVKAHIAPDAELMTDAARGYLGLADYCRHKFVDHAVRYVEGRVSTNGLENFWSLTKRTIKGTYVSVEPAHLLAYLDEQAFRFNERGKNDAGRFVKAMRGTSGKRLTYHKLIGEPQGINSPDPLRGGPRAD